MRGLTIGFAAGTCVAAVGLGACFVLAGGGLGLFALIGAGFSLLVAAWTAIFVAKRSM